MFHVQLLVAVVLSSELLRDRKYLSSDPYFIKGRLVDYLWHIQHGLCGALFDLLYVREYAADKANNQHRKAQGNDRFDEDLYEQDDDLATSLR